MKRTRFAPSPTGYLHLGHAFSALQCWGWAAQNGGEVILRIEDIDHTRCREQYVEEIFEDLGWMGFAWQGPVRFQSQHGEDYRAALRKLQLLRVLYPCSCSRKDIENALSAPHIEDHSIYPGTCRDNPAAGQETPHNLRLDVKKAIELTGPIFWLDEREGKRQVDPDQLGDVVIARKDIGTSYHLSVVVDDALQGIDTVIRGKDLFQVTHIHRLLQALLDLPTPDYIHHDLLVDKEGNRLAKRSGGTLIKTLREEGHQCADILEKIKLFS
jgi:glutamyl-Q tRNA(Asp) synthetase